MTELPKKMLSHMMGARRGVGCLQCLLHWYWNYRGEMHCFHNIIVVKAFVVSTFNTQDCRYYIILH
jgi:hypothetical protein